MSCLSGEIKPKRPSGRRNKKRKFTGNRYTRKQSNEPENTDANKNGITTVTFVCGNQGKIDEINSILQDTNLKIQFQKIDLDELQGDSDFVCTSKCKAAATIIGGPVVVEDTSLCFHALNGLPGPYIKWFYEKLGPGGLHKLLTGFEDKSATAICILGFSEGPGKDVVLCHGEIKGTIVEPKGNEGFGWDSCFLPEGLEKTLAELSSEEKNKISHRRKALNKLKMHFNDKESEDVG